MSDDELAKRKSEFSALLDAANICNAEEVTVIGRARDGAVLYVAAYSTGESAAELVAFLERVREEAKDE